MRLWSVLPLFFTLFFVLLFFGDMLSLDVCVGGGGGGRKQPLDLDPALSESEALAKIRTIADKNKVRGCWSFLAGCWIVSMVRVCHAVPYVAADTHPTQAAGVALRKTCVFVA